MKDAGGHTRATVLIADPHAGRRSRIHDALSAEAECLDVASGAEALKACQENFVEVVIAACGDSAPEGLPLLREITTHWPETVMIALADRGTDELPEDLYQICHEPPPPEAMRRMLRNAVQLFRVRRENDRMSFEMQFMAPRPGVAPGKHGNDDALGFEAILRSPGSPMAALISEARHLASFDVSLLLVGASGTGKAALAKAIHGASLRADRPFLALDVAGLSDEQLVLELCGLRNNGSSRVGLFARASRGTLFLSGIDVLTPPMQLWLSRVLSTGQYNTVGASEPQRTDFRLICGTSRDLRLAVGEGTFRSELFHQIAVSTLDLPPLADRPEDLPLLAQNALFNAAAQHGKSVRGVSEDAMAFLAAYPWPGNLPELRNELTRMLIFAQEPVLGANLISRHILQMDPEQSDPGEDAVLSATGPLKDRVEAIEKRVLREALTRLKWNKSRAAQELGLSRVGLRAKLERYGLSPGVIETAEEA